MHHGFAAPSGEDDFDLELLHQAQRYLKCRSRGRAPGGRLTAAWEQFFHTYDPLIRRFADKCQVPGDSRDDCAQLVWLVLIRKLPGFRYDPRRGRFRSWLKRIIRGKVIDLRRPRIRHPVENLPAHAAAALPGDEADPAASYEQQRRRESVWCVLGHLRRQVSESSYRVLFLRCIEGRTVLETVACLGLTQAQVWYREHRMKRKFGRLFRQYAGGAGVPDGGDC